MEKLAQKAIRLALDGDWEKALQENLKILHRDPEDIDALNRAARAQAEMGKFSEARKMAQKVIALDPNNKIANRALDKWKRAANLRTNGKKPVTAESFLEEPGKTKIVDLINLGDSKVISGLSSADEVKLVTRGKSICVLFDQKYIGRIPDDLSVRLGGLMQHGNEYQALVKTADSKDVKIFLRETKRVEKLKDIPSFSSEKINYIAFTPPELVHAGEDSPRISDEEED